MALFKILKGKKENLPTTRNEGYCYVTTDEHKMYIDSTSTTDGRFALNAANADSADKLNTNAGTTSQPIYFSNGKPTAFSSSIGSATQPIYLLNGVIHASAETVGSSIKPIYLKEGKITASTGGAGSTSLPVYMVNGEIKSCTAANVFSSLAWVAGGAAGPQVSITVAGQKRTSTIPSASSTASGIVTTGEQTFAGAKTFSSPASFSSTITATGRVNAKGKISVPSAAGTYSANKAPSNASIEITTQITSNYHPLLAIQTQNSHYINLGAIADKIGFFGFKSTSTQNGYDSSLLYDVSTGVVSAITFKGALEGNAATASKWQNVRTLSWTGDATGSMNVDGSGNTSATLTLAASGVTSGSYGPSSNASPGVSGTFSVPYFTVDSKGRITSAVTRTITMPTDTKVTNTKNTTTKAYVTGTTSSTTNTGEQIFDTGVYLSATAGELVATKFTGTLNGTATTATKLGSSTVGSSTQPIYLSSGTATTCSTYAGGTKVTLNDSSKAASTADFYAPTSAGTSGYILKSSGSGAPSWVSAFPTLSWTNGTSSGPVLEVQVASTSKTSTIPSANASVSGVVTTSAQTFAGTKTFNAQALFGSGLKIGSSSDGATITYDGSSDTLTITFP